MPTETKRIKECSDEELLVIADDKTEEKKRRSDALKMLQDKGYRTKEMVRNLSMDELQKMNDDTTGAKNDSKTFRLKNKVLCSVSFVQNCIQDASHRQELDRLKAVNQELQMKIETLTAEVRQSGKEETEVIRLHRHIPSSGNRHSVTIAPEIWEEWRQMPNQGELVTVALARFLDDIRSERVSVMWDLMSCLHKGNKAGSKDED